MQRHGLSIDFIKSFVFLSQVSNIRLVQCTVHPQTHPSSCALLAHNSVSLKERPEKGFEKAGLVNAPQIGLNGRLYTTRFTSTNTRIMVQHTKCTKLCTKTRNLAQHTIFCTTPSSHHSKCLLGLDDV